METTNERCPQAAGDLAQCILIAGHPGVCAHVPPVRGGLVSIERGQSIHPDAYSHLNRRHAVVERVGADPLPLWPFQGPPRAGLVVIAPGTKVHVGSTDVEGQVLEVNIGAGSVQYHVAWWNEGTRHTAWIRDFELVTPPNPDLGVGFGDKEVTR